MKQNEQENPMTAFKERPGNEAVATINGADREDMTGCIGGGAERFICHFCGHVTANAVYARITRFSLDHVCSDCANVRGLVDAETIDDESWY